MPDVALRFLSGLTETDTFMHAFILEMSLIQTIRFKTNRMVGYCLSVG
jgi:hypothetical protein